MFCSLIHKEDSACSSLHTGVHKRFLAMIKDINPCLL
uniref:Uncharacterized protein n=1 Tax=Anguilla anguilla TaxID=7936 RepID=A0A0E9PN18_ANGAN